MHYATLTIITETFHLVTYVQLFYCESNGLYSTNLLLLGWFLQHASIARPTINNNYSYHTKAVEFV